MNKEARQWVGYLEHRTEDELWNYRTNVGKGYCTIFADIIRRNYRWRNFMGFPWCAVFVHAVCIDAFGKEMARQFLGKPHPGTRVLARRLLRNGLLRYTGYIPRPGDIVFFHNGDGTISHCGIVDFADQQTVISIEGNTVDPSGHFPPESGGAVSRRVRQMSDPSIVCFGEIPKLRCE